MIDLSRPPLHAEGVTLFADHADPALFHYLPDSPRLSLGADGAPQLTLLKYRFDSAMHRELGAGMLALTVDLGVDEATQARLGGRLRHQFGLDRAPTLAAVTAESGTCELILIDRTSGGSAPSSGGATPAPADGGDASAMVERILGAAAPSLYGDNAATFMAVLSAEGVALVDQAIRGGGLPVGAVYALQVLALRPAMRAAITARWQNIYHYYESRLHGGKLLFATDIGTTVQDLIHSEDLKVAVDDFLPPDQKDDTYQRAVDQMQNSVLDQLFKPTLSTAPPPTDPGGDGVATIGNAIKDLAGFFSLTYTLRTVDANELKTLTYQLNAASAERLTFAPQGTLAVLLAPKGDAPPIAPHRLIIEVTAAASDQMDFDVGTALDLDADGIDHLEVLMSYGDSSADLILDAATPRRTTTFWHQQERGFAVAYSYQVHFKAGVAGAQDVLKSATLTTEDRVIRLNPRELYQRTALRAFIAGVPFDRFPTVIVDVKADDPAEGRSSSETMQLDAAHREAVWSVRAAPSAEVRFQRRLRYVDTQGVETVIDWDYTQPGTLIVGNPFPEVLDVQIEGAARFGSEVRRLIVELRLASDPAAVATRILTADQPFATWSVPLKDSEGRAYQYRVTVHTMRNEVREGQWLAGGGGTLVVGEGIARLRQVQMVFVGKSLKDLQLLGLKVHFTFDDAGANLHAEDEMLVQDTSKTLPWSYPVADPARQAFVYQLTLIHADGHNEVRDPVTSTELLVVCPLT
jgi:hypothetical protein